MRENKDLYEWVVGRVAGCKRTERASRYFGGNEAASGDCLEQQQ